VQVGAVAASEVKQGGSGQSGDFPGLEKRETWGTRRKTLSGSETAPLKPKNGLSGPPATCPVTSNGSLLQPR